MGFKGLFPKHSLRDQNHTKHYIQVTKLRVTVYVFKMVCLGSDPGNAQPILNTPRRLPRRLPRDDEMLGVPNWADRYLRTPRIGGGTRPHRLGEKPWTGMDRNLRKERKEKLL